MASTSIDELLSKDLPDLLRALKFIELPAPSLNWDLLREVASSRAISATMSDNKRDWAAVAILATERGEAAGLIDSESAARGTAMLRAKLISQLESEPGDEILDLETLLEWFSTKVRGLDVNAQWPLQSTAIESLRAARCIKNDLAALSPVIDDLRYVDYPGMEVVRAWWDRRETLP